MTFLDHFSLRTCTGNRKVRLVRAAHAHAHAYAHADSISRRQSRQAEFGVGYQQSEVGGVAASCRHRQLYPITTLG